MFTFEDSVDKYGNPKKIYHYSVDNDAEIIGIIYGHFAPFTGPNGHGRLLDALIQIGATKFIVATPDSRDRIDADRMMYSTEQRRTIIETALSYMGIEGNVATPTPRAIDKMFERLKRMACDMFGPNVRPVFCFGPDREEEFSKYLNKFGSPSNDERAEYIVDRQRGTSGTKVRELIKAGDINGVIAQTGYDQKIAQMLIDMWNENKERLEHPDETGMAGKHSLHHLWNDGKSTQMSSDEFFQLVDYLDKEANDKISKANFSISEKIDGSSSFVGVDDKGLFFTKFGYSSKTRSADALPPKYKNFFNLLEQSKVADALDKWREKLNAKEVKVQIENVIPDANREKDSKDYIRIVLVPYLAAKIGTGLVVTIQALVDGKETKDEKAIMADTQKALQSVGLNARGTVDLDFQDIDLAQDIKELKSAIKDIETEIGQDIKTILSGSKRSKVVKYASEIVQKYQKQIQDKIVSQFPKGQFGDYYEGLVITAANGMIFKATSDKFKQFIAGGIKESVGLNRLFNQLLNEQVLREEGRTDGLSLKSDIAEIKDILATAEEKYGTEFRVFCGDFLLPDENNKSNGKYLFIVKPGQKKFYVNQKYWNILASDGLGDYSNKPGRFFNFKLKDGTSIDVPMTNSKTDVIKRIGSDGHTTANYLDDKFLPSTKEQFNEFLKDAAIANTDENIEITKKALICNGRNVISYKARTSIDGLKKMLKNYARGGNIKSDNIEYNIRSIDCLRALKNLFDSIIDKVDCKDTAKKSYKNTCKTIFSCKTTGLSASELEGAAVVNASYKDYNPVEFYCLQNFPLIDLAITNDNTLISVKDEDGGNKSTIVRFLQSARDHYTDDWLYDKDRLNKVKEQFAIVINNYYKNLQAEDIKDQLSKDGEVKSLSNIKNRGKNVFLQGIESENLTDLSEYLCAYLIYRSNHTEKLKDIPFAIISTLIYKELKDSSIKDKAELIFLDAKDHTSPLLNVCEQFVVNIINSNPDVLDNVLSPSIQRFVSDAFNDDTVVTKIMPKNGFWKIIPQDAHLRLRCIARGGDGAQGLFIDKDDVIKCTHCGASKGQGQFFGYEFYTDKNDNVDLSNTLAISNVFNDKDTVNFDDESKVNNIKNRKESLNIMFNNLLNESLKMKKLSERVQGNRILAWSSSKSPDLFEFYLNNTLRYGGTAGSAYGFATYLVTEPPMSDAAEVGYSDSMRNNLYGTNVFEFMISTRNVLIFMYDDFLKTPLGQKTNASFEDFIKVQCDYIGLDLTDEELAMIQPESPDDFTSKQAVNFYKIMSRHYYQGRRGNLRTPCDGLEYKGRNDGKVLVIWNSQRLVPIAFSNDNGQTWKDIDKSDPRYKEYLKKAAHAPDPKYHDAERKSAIFDGNFTPEKEKIYRLLQRFNTNDHPGADSMSPGIFYQIRIHDDKTIDAAFKSNLPMVDGYMHYWRLQKDNPMINAIYEAGYKFGTLECGLKIGAEKKNSDTTYNLSDDIPEQLFPEAVTEGLKLVCANINKENLAKIKTKIGKKELSLTLCQIEEDVFDGWEVHLSSSKPSYCEDGNLLIELKEKYDWAEAIKAGHPLTPEEKEHQKKMAKLEKLKAKIDAAKTDKSRAKAQAEYDAFKEENGLKESRRFNEAYQSHDKAALIVHDKDLNILICHGFKKGDGPNKNDLPKGSIDGDETPQEAAVRECKEETGLKFDVSDIGTTFKSVLNHRYGDDDIYVSVLRDPVDIDLGSLHCDSLIHNARRPDLDGMPEVDSFDKVPVEDLSQYLYKSYTEDFFKKLEDILL